MLTTTIYVYKERVLVEKMVERKHDETIDDVEEVLTKLRMETNVTFKFWFSAAMRRIKEILRLVGGPEESPLAGKGAVDVLSMSWLKLCMRKESQTEGLHTPQLG